MSEECKYYYYDSGYCCALKKEKEGASSIDDDTVRKYCWGYHYEDCPRYKAEHDSGGCFITSACVEARGLPDDCHELTVLRQFRETYLRAQPSGAEEIAEYYFVAPQIVSAIKKRADAHAIFGAIYEKLVAPCVAMIERGENEAAHQLYRRTVEELREMYLAYVG